VVLLGAGADVAWHALGHGKAPPGKPPEPFFMVLEPPPQAAAPPPPAAPAAAAPTAAPVAGAAGAPSIALPALPGPTSVPQVTSKPPQDMTAAAPAAPGPAPPAAAPQAPGAQTAAAVAPPAPQAKPPAPPAIWQQLASPFDANDTRPRIAVVIVDLGLSSAATQAAIQNLPARVTLGFSPYADNLTNWINLARAAGHEVLLGLPMEPTSFPTRDPGPETLLTSLSPTENLDRLNWVLSRATGYVGVTNNMGSRFTASAQALRPVLVTLRDRGLMFLDARTTPRSEAAHLATEIGLPRAINDRMIDEEASRVAIDAMLADVEKVAKETGNAVAMGQAYPVTFERLSAWLPTLDGKGIVLAPITALVNRQPDG
jgi:polysaccharide deacetylase 2 family uncharacterized protein YibQ